MTNFETSFTHMQSESDCCFIALTAFVAQEIWCVVTMWFRWDRLQLRVVLAGRSQKYDKESKARRDLWR